MHSGISRPFLKTVVILSLVMATCVPGAGQSPAIDSEISSYMSQHHVPGLSLAVVNHGRVVLAKGYGMADVEAGVPATGETVYRIASISKPVSATAAMKLVEAGKLDLDAPIQKYCPTFPKKPWTITTREVLSHQSGIRDYRNDAETLNTRHYSSINEARRNSPTTLSISSRGPRCSTPATVTSSLAA